MGSVTKVAKVDVEEREGKSPGSARAMRSWAARHKRVSILAVVLIAGLVAFILVWFQPQQAFLNTTVDEARPGGSPSGQAAQPGSSSSPGSAGGTTLASGRFTSLEHETTGRAVLVRLSDGALVLRFEELDTLNGPDLHVYLSEVPAGRGDRAYGERFVDLGKLKGNKGNQNYRVPANVDPSRYRSAVIWCKRFAVGFGVAPLD
jgi:Electron transfer DM13